MKTLLPLIFGLLTLGIFAQDASYDITFTSTWSQSTHPHTSGSLPGNAHWSNLVGAIHDDNITFVEMGEMASPGVEDVAELGSNNVFFNEVNQAITEGTALEALDGGAISTSSGQVTLTNVTLTQEFSHISLLSMIAPSPDWIIAVSSVNLLDDTGNWRDEIVIDLFPYDAGTDDGVDYTSGNSNTNPAQPISSLQGVMPFSQEKMGTITFSLAEVLSTPSITEKFSVDLFPNPATDKITVSTAEATSHEITFFSVLGQEVMSIFSNKENTTMDISSLASGVYLIKVASGDQSITQKLVIR
ncbi:hypothetical protein GCM10009117_22170 [Gangjinia marincola]|uniref:Spondin domain-containing protein n=1 Tax=Gangjinia marincola TaxID=578463 RepID=A0ABN1MIM9_9FLAO